MLETAATGGAAATVTVARSLDELAHIRDAWERLQGSQINADPEYFLTVLEAQESVVRPHVVVLERDGEPHAMLVGRVEDVRLSTKLGYRTVYAPRVRALNIVNGGFLGEQTRENANALLGELRAALARREADVARIRRVVVGSPLYTAATTSPPFLARQHLSAPVVRRRLRIPETYEAFLQTLSGKSRQSLRRYGRKLEEEFGDRLSLEIIRDEADLERFFAAAEEIGRKTYQHGLGVTLAGDEVARRLTELVARRGWFRGYVLFVDDNPIAWWHGHGYRGVFATGVPGYDPAFAHHRVGTYVLLRLIEDLCADGETQILDFGSGDAEYKQRFSDESWYEEDVLVWPATPRGIQRNLTRTGVLALIGAAKAVARRNGVGAALKNRWRARLRSDAS